MKKFADIARLFQTILVLLCLFSFAKGEAQRGYSKDSLQIKVYAEILYQQSKATSIEVTKVFCAYCNDTQTKLLEEIGYEKAYIDRYAKENRMKDGKKRLAIYLRLPKDKFRELKNE